jgi:hypothetical protein
MTGYKVFAMAAPFEALEVVLWIAGGRQVKYYHEKLYEQSQQENANLKAELRAAKAEAKLSKVQNSSKYK